VDAPTAIGRRLTNTLAYGGRIESIVLLEEPESLDGEPLQEEEAEAKAEVEKARPGLTMFTDGSRMEDGAAGYFFIFFICLFITRVRPMEIMARLCTVRFLSAVRAVWLVASTPLPSAQACPKKERCRTKEIIRGNNKGNHKGKKSAPAPKPLPPTP